MYSVAERLGYLSLKPRANSPLSLFSKYDGNIIGGSMLGMGMALAGACPGTLVVQMGAGVRTGFFSFLGAVSGGIAWSGFLSKAIKSRNEKSGARPEVNTLMDQTGLPPTATLALLETAAVALVTATTIYTPSALEPKLLGAVGGSLIVGAQLFSIVTRRTLMGVSGSYDEMGQFFWWAVRGGAKPGHGNIVFFSGVLAGAFALAQAVPGFVVKEAIAEVPPVFAVLGGWLMIVGSRMAGGCTSGHGISGISLLSTSSIITIASAFAAGGLVATLAL